MCVFGLIIIVYIHNTHTKWVSLSRLCCCRNTLYHMLIAIREEYMYSIRSGFCFFFYECIFVCTSLRTGYLFVAQLICLLFNGLIHIYKNVTEIHTTNCSLFFFFFCFRYINSLSIVIVTYRSIEININQVSTCSLLKFLHIWFRHISLTCTVLIFVSICYCTTCLRQLMNFRNKLTYFFSSRLIFILSKIR